MGRFHKENLFRGSLIKFPWEDKEFESGGLGIVVYLVIWLNEDSQFIWQEHKNKILLDPVDIFANIADPISEGGPWVAINSEYGEDSRILAGCIKLGETNCYPLPPVGEKPWEASFEDLTQNGEIFLAMLKTVYPDELYTFHLVTAADT